MRLSLILLALLLVSGCTAGPDYQPPDLNPPEQWLSTSRPAPVVDWWRTFNDPVLDGLIADAVRSNLDLKIATARVREARAIHGATSAGYYPSVDAKAGYTRTRSSENISGFSGGFSGAQGSQTGQGGQPGGTQSGGFSNNGEEFGFFNTGFDATWEIDLFGHTRRSVEAADADLGAAIEDRRDVLVSMMSEVARNYVELRAFQRRADIARGNVEAQTKTLKLTEGRAKAGVDRDLDVARQRALVQTTAAQIPALEASAAQAEYQIAVLLGLRPDELHLRLATPAPIPPAPPTVPMGLPSDLLRRRPDLRRAERQLAAATARVGVASADFYPRFNLVGSLGLQSDKLVNLFDAKSLAWSLAPSLNVPLFQGGRLRANLDAADARTDQALRQYEKSFLVAMQDVEGSLVSYVKEKERRAILASAVQDNQRAVELARARYTSGVENLLSVLDAQRSLYAAEDALAQSDRTTSASVIALYKSLGGGWEEFESPK